MKVSETYTHHPAEVFDYMRVNAFIQDMVDARALGTAFEIGLIDFLVKNQPGTLVDIIKEIQCDGRGLGLLLTLLKKNRVVEELDGAIKLSRQFMQTLPYFDLLKAKLDFANFVASDFTDLFTLLIKNPVQFSRNARVFDLFGYNRCIDHSPENYALAKRWMRLTTSLTRYEAQACMKYYDFGNHRHILDVGGNSGEFMIQICKKHPEILATVLDLPVVCDIGREHLRNESESDRINFIKGNAFTDVLPEGFDLITFKSILHDWPDEEAKHLILKAGQSLKPGGRLLIFERGPVEFGETTWPYSLIPFLLFFRSFRLPVLYEEQLKKTGFQDIAVQRIDLETPFFLVTATKGI